MLSNCLKNAVEASPEAGEVSVDLLSAADQVVIRLHNRGTVPAAIRETFFCKFATAGKSDGTGLGAYSSKRIAEVHGGTIAMPLTGRYCCSMSTRFDTCIINFIDNNIYQYRLNYQNNHTDDYPHGCPNAS